MSLYYTATRDTWVEPTTGAVIMVSEQQRRYLASSVDDTAPITVFDGTLRFDDRTVRDLVDQARNARGQVAGLRWYGPAAATIAAMTMLGVGIWCLRTSRR